MSNSSYFKLGNSSTKPVVIQQQKKKNSWWSNKSTVKPVTKSYIDTLTPEQQYYYQSGIIYTGGPFKSSLLSLF